MINNENNIKNSDNGNEFKEINLKNKNELDKSNKTNNFNKLQNEEETEKLSQSLKNLFLINKEFAEPVIVKKENKIFTDFHYATFKNSYGENTCYINVILHLLYNIEQLEEFIVSLYEIDESNKNSIYLNKKTNKEEISDNYKLLVLIGNILNQYRDIISEENDDEIKTKKIKQVTIINTLKMRKMLAKVSKNKFPLNTIADPVEFFSFILDILNEYLNEDIHKTFYLELIDEYICNKKGCSRINNKYDKDNFMYHIYIDEILKFIEKENIKVNDFKNKLFEFSHDLFLSENSKICEKCKEKMNHYLICKNLPDYILINCVWKESNPIVDDAMTIFFMMPIKDEFNNLFISQTKTYKKKIYQLFGFILYSFTLSHYIICMYNIDKQVFVLLNDEIVKEFHNIYELLIDITVEELKCSGKAFFYPVMLIYTKDVLYTNKIMKINTLNNNEYKDIINKCNEAIYQYEMQNKKNEEMEENNYKEFIKEQKEIENEIKRSSKYESYLKKKKKDNNLDIQNKEIKQKINFDEDNKEYKNQINERKEEKSSTNQVIKKVLDEKNRSTIGKILSDIKQINGKSITRDLYFGDIIKSDNNFTKEMDKNKNLDNQNKSRANYLYKSNIIWNNRINQEKEMNNKDNKEEINENKAKNETSINPRKQRFHRTINRELNEKYILNNEKEMNDRNRNPNINQNSGLTRVNRKYYLSNRQSN